MAIWKATFFFEAQEQAVVGVGSSLGWTENWYKDFGNSIKVEDVLGDVGITDYIVERLKVLDSVYRMSFVRVSNTENKTTKLKNVYQGNGKFVSTPGNPGQVQCGILIDLEAIAGNPPTESVHHRRFILRGIPSQVVNGNVIDAGNAAVWPIFLRFFDFIGNKRAGTVHPPGVPNFAWGVRWDNALQNPGVPITRITVDTSSFGRQVLVTPVIVLAQNKLVLIKGTPSPGKDANRFWRYLGNTTVNTVQYMVLGKARQPLDVDYTGPGPAVIITPNYAQTPVTQYVIIGLRSRKTGRAFRQLRGRR